MEPYPYGAHDECSIYDFTNVEDNLHDAIKYHPIRFIIGELRHNNFKIISHPVVMSKG